MMGTGKLVLFYVHFNYQSGCGVCEKELIRMMREPLIGWIRKMKESYSVQ
jgi:hypothetical protein